MKIYKKYIHGMFSCYLPSFVSLFAWLGCLLCSLFGWFVCSLIALGETTSGQYVLACLVWSPTSFAELESMAEPLCLQAKPSR